MRCLAHLTHPLMAAQESGDQRYEFLACKVTNQSALSHALTNQRPVFKSRDQWETDLYVRPGGDQLHHDVMMTRSRRQMECGLRLEILVIDRVAILTQNISQDPSIQCLIVIVFAKDVCLIL